MQVLVVMAGLLMMGIGMGYAAAGLAAWVIMFVLKVPRDSRLMNAPYFAAFVGFMFGVGYGGTILL